MLTFFDEPTANDKGKNIKKEVMAQNLAARTDARSQIPVRCERGHLRECVMLRRRRKGTLGGGIREPE